MAAKKNSQSPKPQAKETKKPKIMDELRKPPLQIMPPAQDEFHIVSPDIHVPEGQDTHG